MRARHHLVLDGWTQIEKCFDHCAQTLDERGLLGSMLTYNRFDHRSFLVVSHEFYSSDIPQGEHPLEPSAASLAIQK